MLDQGGPLVRKAAPHPHAIGNKVCFSVMKGAVIPNPVEFGLLQLLLVSVAMTNSYPETKHKKFATGACESPQLSNDAKLKRKRKAQESSDTLLPLEPLIMMLLGIMFTPRATLSR